MLQGSNYGIKKKKKDLGKCNLLRYTYESYTQNMTITFLSEILTTFLIVVSF